MAEPKHFDIVVEGRVQGVSFRATVQAEAVRLGLAGLVRNLPDGRVQVEAEGDEAGLRGLVDWCRRGPVLAQVTKMTVTQGKPLNLRGFEIHR